MSRLGLLRHKILYGLIETRKVKLTRLGEPCAWDIFMEGLNRDSLIICAGAGGDISFEVELHRATGATVLLLDPSPTGQSTVASMPPDLLQGIRFLPCGLAAESGIQTFSLPVDPAEGSYSIGQGEGGAVSFTCRSLQDLMSEHGATRIDLLKMDIEGFEWGVLRQIMAQKLDVAQICVEFHALGGRFRSGLQRYITLLRMRLHGYRLASHYGTADHTFIRQDFLRQA